MLLNSCIIAAACVLGAGDFTAPRPGEVQPLSEAESYTLNTERQIFPTNQRKARGQIELSNPTDYVVVIWAVEGTDVEPCDKTDIRERCKATAIYVTVSKQSVPLKWFGFRTQDGFDWWVTGLARAKSATGEECVRITLAEEIRQGERPAAGWPRRAKTFCVLPDGFAEPSPPGN